MTHLREGVERGCCRETATWCASVLLALRKVWKGGNKRNEGGFRERKRRAPSDRVRRVNLSFFFDKISK